MNRFECASKARTRDIAGAADALRGRSHHPALNPKSRVPCATIASFTAPHLPHPQTCTNTVGKYPNYEHQTSSTQPFTYAIEVEDDEDAKLSFSQETDLARKDKLNAKKNRLDSTAEGPEDMLPASPPMPSAMANAAELVKSPPHEVKMHHISRRVSGIQWKNGDAAGSSSVAASSRMSPEHDPFADPLPAVSTRATTIQAAQSFDSVASLPETQETDVEIDSEPFKRRSMDSITSVGGSKRSRDDDAISGDRDAKRKSPSEEADESAEEPPTSASASGPMAAKKSMESIRSVASVSKRQRDEDDNDANPRETKRPSPPPAKEEPKKQVTPPPKTAPTFVSIFLLKLTSMSAYPICQGGFGSYASTASPFASVKGPSVFGSSVFQAGPSTPGPSTPGPSESVGTKRGFADYAGASPFASAAAKRSKSPTRASSPPPAQARTPQAHATFGASPAFGMGNKPMSLARPKSPSRSSFGSPNAGVTPSAFSSYAMSGSNGFGSPSPFSAFTAANKDKPALALGSSATTGAGFSAGGASAKASSEEKENGTPTPGEADAKSETASPAPGKTEKDTGKSFGARLRAQEEKNEAEADEKVTLTEQDDCT
jgi:Ran-binding protein 3